MFLQLAYKNLDLYTLSKKLVFACYEASQSIPEEEKNKLTQQLRMAALSAYLNIVRGLFRKSKKKRNKFLKEAQRHLQEVDATCPAGYFLTGGGGATSDGGATLIDSAAKSGDPNSTDQTWAVVYYLAPRATTLDSFAFCAKLQ